MRGRQIAGHLLLGHLGTEDKPILHGYKNIFVKGAPPTMRLRLVIRFFSAYFFCNSLSAWIACHGRARLFALTALLRPEEANVVVT